MTTATTAELIKVSDLSKSFESSSGQVRALQNITLEVLGGEIVVLLGPSGCGKSTLLAIFAGLISPTTGEVVVDGEAPRPRRDVGLMFQQPLLFPWRSVLANVLLPAELLGLPRQEMEERARYLLDLVGLEGWESRHHWELSGGMQQRVALARVLLPDPDILLLDEPFGALDEMTRESLDLEMMKIASLTSKTVVLVTHSVYEAVLMADRIFVLTPRPGRIAGLIEIPISRPRDLDASGTTIFAEKVAEVRRLLSGR
jgi:NitT/TauT family transport system ATP-binding protein